MKALLRLYPASWRERYGDEVSALLEDRPPGPSDVLDLLLGALDAHLHRRRPPSAPATRQEVPMSSRIGALAAIAGGALWTLVMIGVVSMRGETGDLFMVLVAASSLAFLVAIAALSAVQARSHPGLIWASFLLPGVGALLLLVGAAAQLYVGDRPFVADVTPWLPWILGLMATLVGCAIFGAVSTTTGALARWAGALLAVTAVLQILALFSGPDALERTPIAVLGGGLVFGGSWVVVGLLAWRPVPMRGVDASA